MRDWMVACCAPIPWVGGAVVRWLGGAEAAARRPLLADDEAGAPASRLYDPRLLQALHAHLRDELIRSGERLTPDAFSAALQAVRAEHAELVPLIQALETFADHMIAREAAGRGRAARAEQWTPWKGTVMALAIIGIAVAGGSSMYFSADSWSTILGYDRIPTPAAAPGFWAFLAVAMPMAVGAVAPFNVYRTRQQLLSPARADLTRAQALWTFVQNFFIHWPMQGLGVGYTVGAAYETMMLALRGSPPTAGAAFYLTTIVAAELIGSSYQGGQENLAAPHYRAMWRQWRTRGARHALFDEVPTQMTPAQMAEELLGELHQIKELTYLALTNREIRDYLGQLRLEGGADIHRAIAGLGRLLGTQMPRVRYSLFIGVNVLAMVAAVAGVWNNAEFAKVFIERAAGDGPAGAMAGQVIGAACAGRNALFMYPLILNALLLRMIKRDPIDSARTVAVNTAATVPGLFFGFTFLGITLLNQSLGTLAKIVVASSSMVMFSAIAQDGIMGIYYEKSAHENLRADFLREVGVFEAAVRAALVEHPEQIQVLHCAFRAMRAAGAPAQLTAEASAVSCHP